MGKLESLKAKAYKILSPTGSSGSYSNSKLNIGYLAHISSLGHTSGPKNDDGSGLMMVTSWNFFRHELFWAKQDFRGQKSLLDRACVTFSYQQTPLTPFRYGLFCPIYQDLNRNLSEATITLQNFYNPISEGVD